MKRLVLVLFPVLVMISGLAVAASGPELLVAQHSDITSLDPAKSNNFATANVLKLIFSYLVTPSPNMDPLPDLATSWENPDARTWIFHLRKGVTFHDATPCTADDVVFSLKRVMDPATHSAGQGLLRGVTAIEAVDDYTVKIVTQEPYAPLLINLTRYELGIVSRKAVEKLGDAYATQPIGSGPFRFAGREPGIAVLERFDGYFNPPKCSNPTQKVTFRGIPEAATRVMEMEAGTIDIINIAPSDYKTLAKNPKVTLHSKQSLVTMFIGMNLTKKPFDDKRVRQAMNYAVDKKAIVDAVLYGRGNPSRGPLSSAVWGFDTSIEPVYPYNPEKARALLKEAGFPKGFTCDIWTDSNTVRKTTVEMVQGYLAEVGIDAKINVMEWPTLLAETRKGTQGLFIMGWAGTGDADGGLHPRFHSSGIGANNRNQWNSPELDAMLDEGRRTIDPEARKAVYAKIQKYIVDQAPDIFLYIQENLAASRAGVSNYVVYPNDLNPVFDVCVEQAPAGK